MEVKIWTGNSKGIYLDSPNKSYRRPFKRQINVSPNGCSLPLQRVLVAFGLEKSFEKAIFSMKEHYGVEIGASTLRKGTLEYAEKATQKAGEAPKGLLEGSPVRLI